MKITTLNQALKDKERVNVFIDGKFRIAVDKTTLAQEKLFVGKEIDNLFLEKLKDLDTFNLITRKIVSWAISRPRSSKEISDKVKKIINNRNSSSFNSNINSASLIEHVTNKLKDLGIDDNKFALWWIENRQNQGKYGKQRIQSELINKGLPLSLARELINENYPEDTDTAHKILYKKFGVSSVKEIKDHKIKSKAYRFLISKGFKVV